MVLDQLTSNWCLSFCTPFTKVNMTARYHSWFSECSHAVNDSTDHEQSQCNVESCRISPLRLGLNSRLSIIYGLSLLVFICSEKVFCLVI